MLPKFSINSKRDEYQNTTKTSTIIVSSPRMIAINRRVVPFTIVRIPSCSFFTSFRKGSAAMKEIEKNFSAKQRFSTSKIPLSAYRFTEKEDARALG
ncbi:hypothetical protein CCM_03229 [Cordyceps militaris CM01]|uniref:Uncharacterized protein n=1 Tax=Cordyceps militaris (strain CM01) TaxID=983644 RepID=G3J9I0_CORMM|nr:uncharacterized protein CCM_03229 [Cordyceps militaris CM01]EGX94957.1 hypothetical protein CCM_03229 [Cordyceps militaris CM01]